MTEPVIETGAEDGVAPEATPEVVSPLDMSEEDFAKFTFPDEDETPPVEDEPEDDAEVPVEEELPADEPVEEDVTGDDAEDILDDVTDEVEATDDAETPVDYEAEHKRLLAPFKANGKEITVDNVDEAIKLMQLGAGYNKAMVGMKGQRKFAKMLENNDLLDEAKLSQLIDISKGDVSAITALFKEKGIDPLNVDIQTEADYTPGNHSVTDNSIALDEVLDSVKATELGEETINIISNEFDQESKNELLRNPSNIALLNAQRQSGVYQQIMGEVNKQRMLGSLPAGLTDLAAYTHIGNQIQARNGFATQAPANEIVTRKPKAPVDHNLRARKKAASPTKQQPVQKKAAYDGKSPLDMSEAELEAFGSKYL